MKDTTTYGKLTRRELEEELMEISGVLSYLHRELGALCANQHRDYLLAWSRSPGNSVAAKNKEAEYEVKEITMDLIQHRAKINSLIEVRNLILYFLIHTEAQEAPYFPPADLTADGMVNAN